MKNFFIFLGQNPKVWITAGLSIINYLIKLCGLKVLDGPEYDKAIDAISWILGALAVYWAGKGTWPPEEKK